MKKSHLNWAIQFLTVSYDGAYSHNVSVKMVFISFGALPCGGDLDDSSRVHVLNVELVCVCCVRAFFSDHFEPP